MAYEHAENYRLLDKIGSGGSGEVYRALDPMNNAVAVKFLNIPKINANSTEKEIRAHDTAKQRFEREISSMRKINQSNVVKILDYELDTKRPFIVQEYIAGVSLEDYIERNGAIAGRDLVYVFDQLLDALDAIHLENVIHRDIKPSNILLMTKDAFLNNSGMNNTAGGMSTIQSDSRPDGDARRTGDFRDSQTSSLNFSTRPIRINSDSNISDKTSMLERQTENIQRETLRTPIVDLVPIIIDFSISQSLDDKNITRTGMIMGTPGYVAPEAIVGDRLTFNIDWWALAATMVFCSTGRAPFGLKPIETVMRRSECGYADLVGLPLPIATVFSRVLQTRNNVRSMIYDSLDELEKFSKNHEWKGYSYGVVQSTDQIIDTTLQGQLNPTYSYDDSFHVETAPIDLENILGDANGDEDFDEENATREQRDVHDINNLFANSPRLGISRYLYLLLLMLFNASIACFFPVFAFILSVAEFVVYKIVGTATDYDLLVTSGSRIVKSILCAIPLIAFSGVVYFALLNICVFMSAGKNVAFFGFSISQTANLLLAISCSVINVLLFITPSNRYVRRGFYYSVVKTCNNFGKRFLLFLFLLALCGLMLYLTASFYRVNWWPLSFDMFRNLIGTIPV